MKRRCLIGWMGLSLTLAQAQPNGSEAWVGASYESVLGHYQPMGSIQITPWPQANATVHARGGWRGYAKEALSESGAASGSKPHAHAGKP